MDPRKDILQLYLINKMSDKDISEKLDISLEHVQKVLKPFVKVKRSKGETKMINILSEIYPNRKILEQFYFNGQYFDFYIPSLRLVIEYDGIQHSQKSSLFHGEGIAGSYNFENGQAMDTRKDKLAKDDNIYIVRINHKEKLSESNIRKIINEHQQQIINNLKKFSEKL